jgi:predicted ester cyclase
MADSARKQAVRRFYEPYGGGDLATYDAVLTPGWTEHEPVSPDQRPGPANYKPIVAHVRSLFPDIAFAIEAMVEEGDLVAVRSTLSATHTVEAFGLKPTGKRFAILTMDMHRFEGERIAETWHVENWLDMFKQVGAVPGGAS